MSLSSLGCQDYHSDDSSRTAIPFDCFSQGTFDESDRLVLTHALLPVIVAVAVDVC